MEIRAALTEAARSEIFHRAERRVNAALQSAGDSGGVDSPVLFPPARLPARSPVPQHPTGAYDTPAEEAAAAAAASTAAAAAAASLYSRPVPSLPQGLHATTHTTGSELPAAAGGGSGLLQRRFPGGAIASVVGSGGDDVAMRDWRGVPQETRVRSSRIRTARGGSVDGTGACPVPAAAVSAGVGAIGGGEEEGRLAEIAAANPDSSTGDETVHPPDAVTSRGSALVPRIQSGSAQQATRGFSSAGHTSGSVAGTADAAAAAGKEAAKARVVASATVHDSMTTTFTSSGNINTSSKSTSSSSSKNVAGGGRHAISRMMKGEGAGGVPSPRVYEDDESLAVPDSCQAASSVGGNRQPAAQTVKSQEQHQQQQLEKEKAGEDTAVGVAGEREGGRGGGGGAQSATIEQQAQHHCHQPQEVELADCNLVPCSQAGNTSCTSSNSSSSSIGSYASSEVYPATIASWPSNEDPPPPPPTTPSIVTAHPANFTPPRVAHPSSASSSDAVTPSVVQSPGSGQSLPLSSSASLPLPPNAHLFAAERHCPAAGSIPATACNQCPVDAAAYRENSSSLQTPSPSPSTLPYPPSPSPIPSHPLPSPLPMSSSSSSSLSSSSGSFSFPSAVYTSTSAPALPMSAPDLSTSATPLSTLALALTDPLHCPAACAFQSLHDTRASSCSRNSEGGREVSETGTGEIRECLDSCTTDHAGTAASAALVAATIQGSSQEAAGSSSTDLMPTAPTAEPTPEDLPVQLSLCAEQVPPPFMEASECYTVLITVKAASLADSALLPPSSAGASPAQVPCGQVVSGQVTSGQLAVDEMTVTDASVPSAMRSSTGVQSDIHNDSHCSGGGISGRVPIDLVTVLDVSGSMRGPKLDLLKQAMMFVLSVLGPDDRLSIVTFSDTARRVLPLVRMVEGGKERAARAVTDMVAHGGTNIAEGLLKGLRVVEERREMNPVTSVMLLSDGQDTTVVSSRAGMPG